MLLQAVLLVLPLHASKLPIATKSSNIAIIARHLRRLGAMPKSSKNARTAPPRLYHRIPRGI